MMRTIRYAIVGFGGIALNRLAKEGFALDRARFAAPEGIELVGVSSRSETRRNNAEELGLHWYKDIDEILADQSLDAVFVASDNLSHAGQARKILQNGKHCIVEKPMATTIVDARELGGLAAEKGLSIGVNHMMVHNACNRMAKEIVSSGRLGPVADIVLHMEFLYGADPAEAITWRCAEPEQRGGPIGDVGSHCAYMAEFLLGSKINSVACTALPRSLDIAVENGALIRFEMDNGLSGEIRVSFASHRASLAGTLLNLGFEIYGSEAVLRSYGTLGQLSGHPDEPIRQRLELDRAGIVEMLEPESIENIYAAVIKKHAESIRNGNPLNAAEAIHNLEIVLACYDSMASGGKVTSVFS